jgi:hypothetical protein
MPKKTINTVTGLLMEKFGSAIFKVPYRAYMAHLKSNQFSATCSLFSGYWLLLTGYLLQYSE